MQRQPRLPSHENIKIFGNIIFFGTLTFRIHTLLHYFQLIVKEKPLKLIRILPRPETQLNGSKTVNSHYMPIRTEAFKLNILCYST